MSATLQTEHPHVQRDAKGRPTLGQYDLALHILVEYWRLGWSVDELAEAYPFLSKGEIFDGLSYYHDHQEEILCLIEANKPPDGA